jgi:sugar lactone lactonase YvrE
MSKKADDLPKPQVLTTGIAFGESPRWHDHRLWLCDWLTYEIVAIDPAGNREVMLKLPYQTFPFSIDWLPDGQLIIVSADHKQPLLRQQADGSLVAHADLSGLKFQGWNEIAIDGRGNIYINSVGFNLMAGEKPAPGNIDLIAADGSVRKVAENVMFPNGMVVTTDDATLIVAESYAHRLSAFDIGADGTLSNRRVWADLGEDNPDGICLDAEGAIWYADVPHQHCSRVREGGSLLQRIDLDRGGFACALGGEDKKTLFIMTRQWGGTSSIGQAERTGQVVTVKVEVPGIK